MTVKNVTITLTSHPLSREENGVTFVVRMGKSKFGELVVSKGGLRWKVKSKQDHHFSNWTDFQKYMQEKPRK